MTPYEMMTQTPPEEAHKCLALWKGAVGLDNVSFDKPATTGYWRGPDHFKCIGAQHSRPLTCEC